MSKVPKKRTNFSFPVFFNTRVRIFFDHKRKLYQHVRKYRKLYQCDSTERPILCKKEVKTNPPRKHFKYSRSLDNDQPWILAPNRYTVPGDVRMGVKGDFGSFWPHLPRITGLPKTVFGVPKFYDVGVDKLKCKCNKYKGVFLTDPRNRKETTRFMLEFCNTSNRGPHVPSAFSYCPLNGNIGTNNHYKKTQKPLIYKFLPNSVVPVTENVIHKHCKPEECGPGRFNVRDVMCICGARYLYDPDIFWKFQEAKLRRFRRLPFRKLPFSKFCPYPHLRNIEGHGHTRLFRQRGGDSQTKSVKGKEKVSKMVLYATADYIKMITKPKRETISLRPPGFAYRKPKVIKYDTLRKLVKRKQLKVNKKVAFLSGCPRFKGDEVIPKVLPPTDSEKELKKQHKIFHENPPDFKDLKTRLHDLPERFKVSSITAKERQFTFSRLPPPKVLLTEAECKYMGDLESGKLNPEMFFKDEFLA